MSKVSLLSHHFFYFGTNNVILQLFVFKQCQLVMGQTMLLDSELPYFTHFRKVYTQDLGGQKKSVRSTGFTPWNQ